MMISHFDQIKLVSTAFQILSVFCGGRYCYSGAAAGCDKTNTSKSNRLKELLTIIKGIAKT